MSEERYNDGLDGWKESIHKYGSTYDYDDIAEAIRKFESLPKEEQEKIVQANKNIQEQSTLEQ